MTLQSRDGFFWGWARASLLVLTLLAGRLAAAEPNPLEADKSALSFIRAAQRGDLVTLEHLLTDGTQVNVQDASGLTALQAARQVGQTEAADFLVAKGADPQLPLPPLEKMVDVIFARRLTEPGPGAALLIARDGKILLSRGYGLADLDGKVAITPKTKFRIGSVTKQFTAAAIVKLQEEGKLSVDDSLSKYYPDFPRGSEVTLRHLLTHTSGIHNYTDQADFRSRMTKKTDTKTIIDAIKTYPLDFSPGEKWLYSNSGYVILGDIVEKVSGQTYEAFLRNTFFAPLGMKDTGVYNNESPPSDRALGYGYVEKTYKLAADWDMTWAGGAGTLYSTVEDLFRWNEALFGGKVINAENFKAATAPAVTKENEADKPKAGYGYGLGVAEIRGARIISHSGGLDGFNSTLTRLVDQRLTVVVLTNSLPPKPGMSSEVLANELIQLSVGPELGTIASKPKAVEISPAAIAAIVGRYDYHPGILTVTNEGTHVFAQLGPQERFEIFPTSPTEFYWKVVEAKVSFVTNASGVVTEAVHQQGGRTIHAPRLADRPEIKLSLQELAVYVGQYDFGQGRTLAVSLEGDRLYVQLTGQGKLEIGAMAKDEFFLKAVNAQLTFVRDTDGKITKVINHQNGKTIEAMRLP